MADADPIAPAEASPPVPAQRGGARAHLHTARERWRRLPLPVRILLWIVGIIFAIRLILLITKGRFLKGPFEQLYFAPLRIKFRAEGFHIANLPWASRPDLFRADLIDARIALLSLIFGALYRVPWLVRNGAADLEWSRDHLHNTWASGDPDKKGEPMTLPLIRRALPAGATLRYRDPGMQLNADIGFETVKAQDTRFASDGRFSGMGDMRGKPFTLKGEPLSPNATVSGGKNSLAMRAQSGATMLKVSGTLLGATELEGSDLRLVIRGPNSPQLFDFLGVAIPDTRDYSFTSALTKAGEEWRFTHLKRRFGDSALAGRTTVSLPEGRLLFKAELATQALDIIDVAPFIGYNPDKIEAQGAAGAVETVGGALVALIYRSAADDRRALENPVPWVRIFGHTPIFYRAEMNGDD
jgi:uncharacterized protein involved in outer membrane biogenesis